MPQRIVVSESRSPGGTVQLSMIDQGGSSSSSAAPPVSQKQKDIFDIPYGKITKVYDVVNEIYHHIYRCKAPTQKQVLTGKGAKQKKVMVDSGGDTCASIAALCTGRGGKPKASAKQIKDWNVKRYPDLDKLLAGNKRGDGTVAYFQKDTIIYVQKVPDESKVKQQLSGMSDVKFIQYIKGRRGGGGKYKVRVCMTNILRAYEVF